MKGTKKWSVFALIAGIAMLFCSCAVHRHSQHHHRVLSPGIDCRGTDYQHRAKQRLYHL